MVFILDREKFAYFLAEMIISMSSAGMTYQIINIDHKVFEHKLAYRKILRFSDVKVNN